MSFPGVEKFRHLQLTSPIIIGSSYSIDQGPNVEALPVTKFSSLITL